LIRAGARIHQAGCNGCIGMGQAPASGRISLRTVPRNFPGRSFGIVPLVLEAADYERIEPGDEIEIPRIREALRSGGAVRARNLTRDGELPLRHGLRPRHAETVLAGGVVALKRRERSRSQETRPSP